MDENQQTLRTYGFRPASYLKRHGVPASKAVTLLKQ